jgi:hypothetical protein
MKSRSVITVVATLMVSLLAFGVVYAYTGVNGTAIDSSTLQPWAYGGDVWIVNQSNGNILATCVLNTTTGAIQDGSSGTCDYGDDALASGIVNTTRANGNIIEVVVIFNQGPNGQPADASVTFTESAIPTRRNLGYIKSGTGPTAVVLSDLSAESSSMGWLPVVLIVAVVVAAGGLWVVARKRRWA